MVNPENRPVENVTTAEPTEQAVADLVQQARGGDQRAFESLYRIHAGRVHGLCLRLSGDPAEARALTQDVFVRVWRKLDSWRAEGPFGAWLRRLTVNVALEDRRRRSRESKWLVPDGEERMQRGVSIRGSDPQPAIDLERAMARLPEGARTAFVLHDVEGFRHREIAKMTGLAEGTIKAQLHRARKLLREAMETGVSQEVRP
jgi:RNA polymerase sigma-70 factor (ECF subfamily)